MERLAGLHERLKSGVPPQESNLKEPMRVAQLEVGEYSVVNHFVRAFWFRLK